MKFKKFFVGREANSFNNAIQKIKTSQKNQHMFAKTTFVTMQQVHGNNIATVDLKKSNKKNSQILDLKNVDACFTHIPNVLLSIKSADCLPIIICGFGTKKDSTNTNMPTPFIAAAHAGRKSTEKQITKKLLEKLESEFQFCSILIKNNQSGVVEKTKQNSKLNIWFGPAICKKCYQIDRKTDLHYDLIAENKKQVLEFCAKHKLDHKKYLNLEIENHCTLHEPDKFHSYRKTGPNVKMNYSFIAIN